MYRNVFVLMALFLLAGEVRAGSVATDGFGQFESTELGAPDNVRFGAEADLGSQQWQTIGQVFNISRPTDVSSDETKATVASFTMNVDNESFGRSYFGVTFVGFLATWDADANQITGTASSELFMSSAMTLSGRDNEYRVDTVSTPVEIDFEQDYVAFITTLGVEQENTQVDRRTREVVFQPSGTAHTAPNDGTVQAVVSSAQSVDELRNSGAFDLNAGIDFALLVDFGYDVFVEQPGGDPPPVLPPGHSPEPTSCLMWAFFCGTGLVCHWRRRRRRRV